MSVYLMGLVWKADFESPARKLIALRLADFSNDDGDNIFPSVARIARDTATSERTVRQALHDFKEEGFLSVVKQGGDDGRSPTHYRMNIEALAAMVAPQGCNHCTPRVQPLQARGAATPPKPLREPSEQPETPEVGVSARERAPDQRGTRLPQDWSLPPDWKADGLAILKDEAALALEADKFRDYWLSLPGPKGRKLDWKRTFLNWCRNAKPARSSGGVAEELPAWRRDQMRRFAEFRAAVEAL